jgi:hypothetical protein
MSKNFELVAQIFGSKRMTIEPLNGYTAAKVAESLNTREAAVSGDQIIKWAPPPAEGGIVIAKILKSGDDFPDPAWQVASKEELEAAELVHMLRLRKQLDPDAPDCVVVPEGYLSGRTDADE